MIIEINRVSWCPDRYKLEDCFRTMKSLFIPNMYKNNTNLFEILSFCLLEKFFVRSNQLNLFYGRFHSKKEELDTMK